MAEDLLQKDLWDLRDRIIERLKNLKMDSMPIVKAGSVVLALNADGTWSRIYSGHNHRLVNPTVNDLLREYALMMGRIHISEDPDDVLDEIRKFVEKNRERLFKEFIFTLHLVGKSINCL